MLPVTAPRAIQATFSDFRVVKGRKVLQLIMEVPVEEGQQALEMLGFPHPHEPQWVAIALIDKAVAETKPVDPLKSEASKHAYRAASERERAVKRAAILCNDPIFQVWLAQVMGRGFQLNESNWSSLDRTAATADNLRKILNIKSRTEIADNDAAYNAFIKLETECRQSTGMMAEIRG